MQILIPMGGAGSRFVSAGFDDPKPFIKFLDRTMIENVVENLGLNNQFILVVQEEHFKAYKNVFDTLTYKIMSIGGSLVIQFLSGMTRGAAESCLMAKDHLDPNKPLMIANSDQMMEWNEYQFKSWFLDSGLDGAIMTFESQNPKNSYAEVDKEGFVVRTAEKEVISTHATNGIYVWRKARDFIDAAKEMMMLNLRVNNEFYVCPCYNRNISWKQKIGIYPIKGHHPIGTPSDLVAYLDHLVGKNNGNN